MDSCIRTERHPAIAGRCAVKTAASRLAAALGDHSPESVALIVSLGLVLGTFPIFGFPTLLCAAAALMLRLNVPALQLMNQLSTPLQLVLLAPLTRAGAWIIADHAGGGMAERLGTAALRAAAGWSCICVPLGISAYFAILYCLRRRPWRCFNGVESMAR